MVNSLGRTDDDLDYDWEGAMRSLQKLQAGFSVKRTYRSTPLYEGLKPGEYIGFVPTPMIVVRRMLEMAEVQAGETVYDLGCGDGRILISASRKYDALGVGIDINRERLIEARLRAGPYTGRIRFLRQNVFQTDLRRADVVMIYLLPSLNAKLMPRLRKLRRGVRVVSHSFELPGVEPYKVARIKAPDGHHHLIYAYRTPLRRS
jgi:SAM-dependent methyltransferase